MSHSSRLTPAATLSRQIRGFASRNRLDASAGHSDSWQQSFAAEAGTSRGVSSFTTPRRNEEIADDVEEVEQDTVFLSIFYGSGRVGAAAYIQQAGTLMVLPDDLDDIGPDFRLATKLLVQLNPRYLVACSKQPAQFIDVLKKACGYMTASNPPEPEPEEDADEPGETTRATNDTSMAHAPVNETRETDAKSSAILKDADLHFVKGKDCEYRACVSRIVGLRLPQNAALAEIDENKNEALEQHERYILMSSLFNMNAESCVKAAGALLKFFDSPAGHSVLNRDASGFAVTNITTMRLEDVMVVDSTTLTALQVFNRDFKLSGTKRGSWNQVREGLSLFNIVNKCRSVLGSTLLRHMFRCPPTDIDIIRQRQDDIAFLASPRQTPLLKSLRDCLKNVRNVPKILKKISMTQASVQDWKGLRRSLVSLLTICDLCATEQHRTVNILATMKECGTTQLRAVTALVEQVMDVERSDTLNRFCVRAGYDADLDEKRRVHNGLPDLLHRVAQEEISSLPDFMLGCTFIYIPQIGYMVAVNPWKDNLTEEECSDIEGMRYMFFISKTPHFKTQRCIELDEMLGDTATTIAEHETSIMIKLTQSVLECSDYILYPARYSALLDCFISLALTGQENGWVRPQMVDAGEAMLQIVNGRHPLQEKRTTTFVANSTEMGRDGPKMIILSGPNACGKSIYLKQVGLIVYLAHLGSLVPADSAVIPVMDRICTRIETVESLSLGLSTFAVDVGQMATILNTATERSLVLVDEFGKGTVDADGQGLLVACLDHLLRDTEKTPFVIVATHFHGIGAYLASPEQVEFKTFEFVETGNDLMQLYKLKPGGSGASYAHVIARRNGVQDHILRRCIDIFNCISMGRKITRPDNYYDLENMEHLADEFVQLNVEDRISLELFLEKISGTVLL